MQPRGQWRQVPAALPRWFTKCGTSSAFPLEKWESWAGKLRSLVNAKCCLTAFWSKSRCLPGKNQNSRACLCPDFQLQVYLIVLVRESAPWLWEIRSEWEKQSEYSQLGGLKSPQNLGQEAHSSPTRWELRWTPEEENSASQTGMVPYNQTAKGAAAGALQRPLRFCKAFPAWTDILLASELIYWFKQISKNQDPFQKGLLLSSFKANHTWTCASLLSEMLSIPQQLLNTLKGKSLHWWKHQLSMWPWDT